MFTSMPKPAESLNQIDSKYGDQFRVAKPISIILMTD